MKKLLLPVFLLTLSTLNYGQNVQDQSLTFRYTQLPSTPFEKNVSTYSVVINADAVTKANDDSINAYNAKVAAWETSYDKWITEKEKIDKAHLLNMANYEKAVNAGNAAAPVPVKPPYPVQPFKEDIPLPILNEDLPNDLIENTISIDGYVKGDNGAIVTIEVLGFQDAKINMKKTGTGPATKYEYTSTAKYPIHVTVSTPGQGVVLDKTVGDALQTDKLKTYNSKYEYDYWALDNLGDYWKQRQKNIFAANLNSINSMINEQFGFPVKTRSTEIYTVKKHKDHDYSDLIDAYSNAKSGYDMVINDVDHSSAKAKISRAIRIWEDALEESNPGDNKARINDKVTALIYENLAEAYMWINDFQQAETYRIKAEQAGVGKYKRMAQALEPLMLNLKARYTANN